MDMKKMAPAAAMAASLGLAGGANAASLLQQAIFDEVGSSFTFLTLTDDDAAIFNDLEDGPDVVTPGIDLGGGSILPGTGGTSVEAIAEGDSLSGSILFPSFQVGFGGPQIATDGFELTGIYEIIIGEITSTTDGDFEIDASGTLSIFEDSDLDADFDTNTGFGAGVNTILLGDFVLSGEIVVSSLASTVPDSELDAIDAFTGASGSQLALPSPNNVDLDAVLIGGLFADPNAFPVAAGFSLGFDLITPPNSRFDFGSTGGLSGNVVAVPSPAAVGVGLFGVLGLVSRRRKNS